jgi:putative RNA 2'-phosphotransferase
MSRASKFLTLVLRHDPGRIGLSLGPGGWVATGDLLKALSRHGMATTAEDLRTIVSSDDKRRFTLSDDGRRIRAAQGHSVAVDLGLQPLEPPEILFHGTATASLDTIFREGLKPVSRTHVHLSVDVPTAIRVGARHGRPIVLEVAAGSLHRAGAVFLRADNDVWLTDAVPPSALALAATGPVCDPSPSPMVR